MCKKMREAFAKLDEAGQSAVLLQLELVVLGVVEVGTFLFNHYCLHLPNSYALFGCLFFLLVLGFFSAACKCPKALLVYSVLNIIANILFIVNSAAAYFIYGFTPAHTSVFIFIVRIFLFFTMLKLMAVTSITAYNCRRLVLKKSIAVLPQQIEMEEREETPKEEPKDDSNAANNGNDNNGIPTINNMCYFYYPVAPPTQQSQVPAMYLPPGAGLPYYAPVSTQATQSGMVFPPPSFSIGTQTV